MLQTCVQIWIELQVFSVRSVTVLFCFDLICVCILIYTIYCSNMFAWWIKIIIMLYCCSDAHPGQWSDVRRFDGITAWLHYEAARWSRDQGKTANIAVVQMRNNDLAWQIASLNIGSSISMRCWFVLPSTHFCHSRTWAILLSVLIIYFLACSTLQTLDDIELIKATVLVTSRKKLE